MGEYQARRTFVKGDDTKLWGKLYANWWACECVKVKRGTDCKNERKVVIIWTGDWRKCRQE